MEKNNFFQGKTLQITEIDPKEDAKQDALWSLGIRYARFRRRDPIRPVSPTESKSILEELLKEMDEGRSGFFFALRTLGEEGQLVGFFQIDDIEWTNGQGYMALFFGTEDLTDKHFEEGLQLALKYAFHELNLYHVIFEIPAFLMVEKEHLEKAGFKLEATMREMVYHQGQHHDQLSFGLLEEEWQQMEKQA